MHPFYLPGHEGLINRLQELRQHPAVEELPEQERNQIDSILEQNTRQTTAISHVDNHLAEVQRCRNHLAELQDLAYTYKLKLEKVHSYDEWHDTAERLLAAGKAIADDRKTYGPCLNHTPHAWKDVHASIRELASALGHDITSLHHRQPELYLEPITRPVPDSQQAKDADASYRRLRDEWHKHVALAESTQTHPYHLKGHAELIDATRELRNLPDLATNAQQALDTLLHDYTPLQQVRQHIHAYLEKAEHALEEYQRFKDTVQELSPLDVRLEDIEGYGEWKDRALRLTDTTCRPVRERRWSMRSSSDGASDPGPRSATQSTHGQSASASAVAPRLRRRPAGQQRMPAVRDGAHGKCWQLFAPQRVRQACPGVETAAVQVALPGLQQAQPFAPAGAAQPQLDPGKSLPEAPDGVRHDALHPERIGGRPDVPVAARERAADPVLRLLVGAQQAPGLFGSRGAERRQPHAGRQAFEQRRAEPALKRGDRAGQRRLADRQTVGRGHDFPRLHHRQELLDLAPSPEHADAFARPGRRIEYGLSMKKAATIA